MKQDLIITQRFEAPIGAVRDALSSYLLVAVLLAAGGSCPASESEAGFDLQYLQHSGWIIRTPRHVLVFDYVEQLPSGSALSAPLKLSANTFDERRVIVFVSHGHVDHFDRVIGEWAKERPDIQYVSGGTGIDLPGVKIMHPREAWASDSLTVKTTGSTDQGVGFLVTVDGFTLYHAGDHAEWTESQKQEFMAEIEWLKRAGPPIDVAFFPVATGARCEPRPSIWAGVRAATLRLAPRFMIPMHVGCPDRLDVYADFREKIGPALTATEVIVPKRLGETFRFSAPFDYLGPDAE